MSGCRMNKESQDTSYDIKKQSGDVSFAASSISFGAVEVFVALYIATWCKGSTRGFDPLGNSSNLLVVAKDYTKKGARL